VLRACGQRKALNRPIKQICPFQGTCDASPVSNSSSLRSLRFVRKPVSPFHTRGLGPFVPGEGGAAGHPIGWFIVAVLILGAAGMPMAGAPFFVFLMLGLSALFGCFLQF
jgi:hypothetical protein